jgi:thiol-disulfide isomerase/thioredoxin
LSLLFFIRPQYSSAIDKGYDGQTPLFAVISTEWCYGCRWLEPIVEQLKREYAGRITFVKLDATNNDTVYYSQKVASDYGILEFFNNNRNAFPRIAIYCPGALSPDINQLGAMPVDHYRKVLDEMLLNSDKACAFQNGRPQIANNGDERPEESKDTTAEAGRPDTVNPPERPLEIAGSGRPDELRFWTYGQPMPLSAYLLSKALVLPECTSPDQVLCYNGNTIQNGSPNIGEGKIFKPYDPNATRNEKEFNNIKKHRG